MIAPAKTGRDSSNNTAVIKTDHEKREMFSMDVVVERMLKIVVIKLIAPKIEDTPAKWREKIARSTETPPWYKELAKGGYTVQPVPTPKFMKEEANKRDREGGNNQNLILFIRGKAISGAPTMIGTSQFPNPPIRIGITMKKIIIKACAVTIVL